MEFGLMDRPKSIRSETLGLKGGIEGPFEHSFLVFTLTPKPFFHPFFFQQAFLYLVVWRKGAFGAAQNTRNLSKRLLELT